MQIIPHFFSSFSLFHSPLVLLELTEVDDLVAVLQALCAVLLRSVLFTGNLMKTK